MLSCSVPSWPGAPDTTPHVQGGGTLCSCLPAFLGHIPAATGMHPDHNYHIGFLSPEHQVFAAGVWGGCLLPTIPTPSSIRPVLFRVLLSRLVLIDFFFHFFFLSLGGSIAGCSRAEDLSTADQAEAEAEAGRTGAVMQPDPAAQPGAGGHHQLQEEAWMQVGEDASMVWLGRPVLELYLIHSQQW